jgi:integrase
MARQTKGRIYTRGQKKYYYLQYYINGKQFVKALRDEGNQPVTTKEKAKELQRKFLNAYSASNEVDRRDEAYTALQGAKERAANIEKENKQSIQIDDGWKVYLKSQYRHDSGDATLVNYQRHYKKLSAWIKDHFSDINKITQIDSVIAGEYAAYLLSKGYSENTYNKHITFLKAFYEVMIEDEHALENPFKKLKRKKLVTNSRKELSVEQVYNLLSSATGELALLLGLGYFTGLRRGDCCTLLWSEVDLIRRIITRIPNKIKGRSSNPKAVKIGICEHLFNAISQIPPDKREDYVLPEIAENYLNNKRDRINRVVKKHFHKCGIQTVQKGTGPGTNKRAITQYGFHSLRYSYISHHADAGTPQAIIQANAGHKNPAMTEHYTNISDEDARRIAGALDINSDSKIVPIMSTEDEPERTELLNLVHGMSIDKVKEILQQLR